jgi:hypothetical protein
MKLGIPPWITCLVFFVIGYAVIRVLNLHLPFPKNITEFYLFSFWKYPPEVDKKRIRYNKIAWFLVVVTSYLLSLGIN